MATAEPTPRASGWRWRVVDLLKLPLSASAQRGASGQGEGCNKKNNPSIRAKKLVRKVVAPAPASASPGAFLYGQANGSHA